MTSTSPTEGARSRPVNERWLLHVYDCYRNTLLSLRYSAARLTRVRRQSRTIEIVLALAAPGAVSGWAIWHTPAGGRVWELVAAAVVVLTVVKPFMNWQSEVERRTGIYMDFNALYFDLKHLVIQIEVERGVSPDVEKKFLESLVRYGKISGNEDPVRSERILRRCREEVEREIPAETLWIPSRDETNPEQASLPK